MATAVRKIVCNHLTFKSGINPLILTGAGPRFKRNFNTKVEKDDKTKELHTFSFEEATKSREVEIRTCGSLFEKWRKEKKFWKVPNSEISFSVKYIDTGHGIEESPKQTVLSLHGSPGSYKDFTPVTEHLYKQGVRVIAPNFPGGDNLQPTVFRHTPEEKAQYVIDFLKAIKVPRVDLIICHSSALFPGLHLSLESKDVAINSLALLNPTGLEFPRLLNPVWLTYSLIRLAEIPFGYEVTKRVGKKIANKPELKGGSFEEHFLSAFTLLHSNIPQQTVPFQKLLNQNFPILLAFSNNDKLISRKTSYKMADMMVNPRDIHLYNKEGKSNGSGGNNPFRKVLAFENGSHFLFRTYPEVICDEISTFLAQQYNNRVSW